MFVGLKQCVWKSIFLHNLAFLDPLRPHGVLHNLNLFSAQLWKVRLCSVHKQCSPESLLPKLRVLLVHLLFVIWLATLLTGIFDLYHLLKFSVIVFYRCPNFSHFYFQIPTSSINIFTTTFSVPFSANIVCETFRSDAHLPALTEPLSYLT